MAGSRRSSVATPVPTFDGFDVLATRSQYVAHLAPVWEAAARQGTFYGPGDKLPRQLPRPVVVASYADYGVARRAGAPRIARMEHGCGQSYGGDARSSRTPAYAGGAGHDAASLFLAPNEHSAARWRRAYPRVPVEVIGMTHELPEPDPGSPPLLVVSFHWSGPIPEQRSALAHYGAGLAELGRAVPVAGHAHPRATDVARRAFDRAGIPFIESLSDVARRATVYAVDNSSTLWELGLHRPTIALDAPWYRRSVAHGLRFWSHAGVSVTDWRGLIETAERLLAGEDVEARQRRLATVDEVIPSTTGARAAAEHLATWSTR